MATYGGWTGKILRVDLSNGKITAEDTLPKYKDWMGGSGLAYKIIWDEVPAGTTAYDPENIIVLAGGPLTGTGAPTGGRCTITSLFPSTPPATLVGSGHMGGHWAAELKFAGWDAVVVTGKSDKPVWLCIEDDNVTLRDATRLWGNGIFRATDEICEAMGNGAHVAAIGQAGENLVNQAVIMCDRSHSGGGLGGVMGSKGLKAIGVRGTGPVQLAASAKEWRELVRYMLSLMGANNQGVVPSKPQSWAEYSGGTRWTAAEDIFWGAAQPPIELGDCPGDDLNKIGYRTHKGLLDFRTADPASGRSIGELITVRMGGCHSCPIRCHVLVDMPSMESKYGLPRYSSNTCSGWQGGQMYPGGSGDPWVDTETKVLGSILADDYGVWNNYSQVGDDFQYAYEHGLIKEALSEEEYDEIPWDLLDAGDPRFQFEYFRRIAYKVGDFGTTLGAGSAYLQEAWAFPEEWKLHKKHWKMGHPYHHSIEAAGQVGVLINLVYNRDPCVHTHSNFYGSGLPIEIKRELAKEVFGSADAVDVPHEWTPMNEAKAVFGKLTYAYAELHNSMTLCNYTLPAWASPSKERDYQGDPELESKIYSAVTGDTKTREELEDIGIKHLTMLRALTMRGMDTVDMRTEHDLIPEWVFDYPDWEDLEPFTAGHDKMDRDDIELAKDMFYDQVGWDKKTGAPTRETLLKYDMKDVADSLARADLLPA